MKRVKFAVTALTLALALTGVVVVKANEKKRATTTIGYFQNAAGTIQITLDAPRFDNTSISTTTKIIDNNNNQRQIFENSDLTGNLKLIP